ncbi:MAG: hypothetical protein IPL26_08610 [Leptospiraceae bacterium]|nr:hypothetical protein [Leptospiraceae bacterium]
MSEYIINKLKFLNSYLLLGILILIAEFLTMIIVSACSLYFQKRITIDYLTTGLVTGFFVALTTLYILIKIFKYLASIEGRIYSNELNTQKEKYRTLYEKLRSCSIR